MFALIMAGGAGKRFWPKSREKHPKQLLNILGEKTLIQNTVDRLSPLFSMDQIFVISNEKQKDEVRRQLPSLPEKNLIVEPKGKNTAPCIGLSALLLEKIDPEAVMIVLPADHLIQNDERFINALRVGARVAREKDSMVTLGIEPTYPSTGYGYIQFNEQLEVIDDVTLLKVKTFAEKPNLATAGRFISSGDFLWNSGIFIWKCKRILRELEEHLPHLYDGLMEIKEVLGTPEEEETIRRVYCQIKSISVDYGVMEHAEDVVVIKGKFGWNDLGSWDEVYNILEKDEDDNVLVGEHIIKDSRNCYVEAPGKCVALMGVNDLIVVDTGDVLLICPRERAQDVKELADVAKRRKLDQYI
ncbi:mannose-1-phosphate guanylyltransferase [candidate division KSB1 bacterium]|nr:mannose-1-phosphate guanylyltransferase [candidate division KSB1 bacterium]NIR71324.1 mannose-1-phosphate guanylyltransferase [candidate division KSB1 bacterium]NIS24834.1 mannose-1-phosphate guanylyltransferase [candidate division KSB1 bacterium]NIT71754.1 mannose-1-phosphate guanylyltransferase [candidate division KSB1 bacterium]NIU25469.1 mannose-1-phosphate guanylyltransferase [candidate division KSB1 bacterium]